MAPAAQRRSGGGATVRRDTDHLADGSVVRNAPVLGYHKLHDGYLDRELARLRDFCERVQEERATRRTGDKVTGG